MTYENRVTPSYEQRAPVMSYENRGEFRSGATVDYRTAGAQYGGYNRQAVSRQEVVGGEFRGGAR